MNFYSEIVLFAIVLAVNLVLLGAILASGLALTFRFIENASPRLRYYIAVAVFVLAILLPIIVTLTIPSSQEILAGSANSQNYAKESIKTAGSSNFAPGENSDIASPASAKNTPATSLGKFISIAANSLFGKTFFGLWISGIAWLLFREALGVRRLRQARRLWEPATEAQRQALFCPGNIPLYFDERQSPGTVGLLYSAIVLPKQFSAGLTPDAKVLIVRHELAHAQRRDPLVSFILRLLRALFWVSPALWLLERLIHSEREAAADRAAIGFLPREPEFETFALNYADTLLTVAKELNSFDQQRREPQIIGIGTRSELEIRIRRLLSASQTTRLHIASAFVASALSLVMIIIFPRVGFSEQFKFLQSEFTAAAAELKTSQPDELQIEPSISNRQDNAAQLPARAGTRNVPGQSLIVKTKTSEEAAAIENSESPEKRKNVVEVRRKFTDYQAGEAAGSLKKPDEILNGKTADVAESDENQPARPLQSVENAGQLEKPIYGPARKTEAGKTLPQAAPNRDVYYGYEPARRKRESEYQSKPINNIMPATGPR